MENIDRFHTFLDVSEMYKYGLGLYNNIGNRHANVHNYILTLHPVNTVFFFINNSVFNITRNLECIKNDNNLDKNLLEYFCKYLIQKYELDKKLSYDSNMSSYEIIESIRNCLAHSNYVCRFEPDKIDEYDGYKIHMNNYRIDGEFEVGIISAISNEFSAFSDKIKKNKFSYEDITNICNIQTNNKKMFETALGTIKKKTTIIENSVKQLEDDGTYVEKGNNNIFQISISPKETISNLKYDETNLIKSYIEYYGLNKWVKLSSSQREKILNNIVMVMNNNTLNYYFKDMFDSYYMQYILSKALKTTLSDKFFDTKVEYFSPIMYSNALMEYSFYTLNYMKESAAKEGFAPLLYRDINVDSFKFNNLDKEKYVKFVNNAGVEIQYNNSLNKERQIIQSIETTKNNIMALSLKDMPDYEKKAKLEKLKARLIKDQEKLNERKKITQELDKRRQNLSYYNCSELFRRLRNSVSHGKFEIDYSKALRNRDFGNMVVRFFDNEGNDDYAFDVEIKAKDLISIYQQLIDNMKRNASYFQDSKVIAVDVYDDVPNDLWEMYKSEKEANSNIIYTRDDDDENDDKFNKAI